MNLTRSPHLDALVGAYLLGTLRGGARRRFQRALQREPAVAARLAYFQRVFAVRYSEAMAVKPDAQVWQRLDRTLALHRYRTPWWRRGALARGWAIAATAGLVVVLGVRLIDVAPPAPQFAAVAELAGTAAGGSAAPALTAQLSTDGRSLRLVPARPVQAGPAQSYELWLLPPGGGKPESMAVLGRLDAQFMLAAVHVGRVAAGAQLAISVEPAGGSPTGAPTGPVILIGAVRG